MNLIEKIRKRLESNYHFKKKYRSLGVNKNDFYYYFNKLLKNSFIEETDFLGKKIKRINPYSFIHTVEGIFVEELYKFSPKTESPLIIDCGSNIGLSIIYFKKLFPNSRIIGFEPDKNIFDACVYNLREFGLSDVQMINAGVWKNDGEVKFLKDNSLGGMIVEPGMDDSSFSTIAVVDIKKYLNQKVDFLKIDIEGAEIEVLLNTGDLLMNVENLFVEYHSFSNQPQKLSELLQFLSDQGFRYYIKHAWDYLEKPYLNKGETVDLIYDLQLNIFGYRLG